MIRLLFFIVLVLVLGFGFAWLADRPGDLVLTWQGQRIETSLMVAVTAVVSLVAAILLSWWIVRLIWTSPRAVTRYFRANKRDRGYQALSTGLIAAGAGDAALARKMNKRAQSLLSADQEPLIHLLDVQAALIEGRHDEARRLFEALSEDPETRLLGLRGLYLEARRAGAEEAARHYAARAAEEAPQLPWAGEATLADRSRDHAWDEALKILERQRQAGLYQKADADRKKAVLLTARATERADSDPAGARDDAQAALKLVPDFVPAALAAARALFREDNLRKGSKILESAWRADPHPQIAEAYVRARIGDSVGDRLKRAQRLESLRPNHAESLYVVARAALEARRFDLAREKAEAAARLSPREGIYLLMADIEEAQTGDQARVRHWLAQALKAPRDPAWTADGYVSEDWEPVSPVTGRLDAFEWKVPLAQLGAAAIDHEQPAAAFEKATASLPPVGTAPVVATAAEKAGPIIDHGPESTRAPAGPVQGRPGAAGAAAESEPEEAAAPAEGAEARSVPPQSVPAAPVAEETAPARPETATVEATEREEAFLSHPPDDPGVAEEEEAEPAKQRFRLF